MNKVIWKRKKSQLHQRAVPKKINLKKVPKRYVLIGLVVVLVTGASIFVAKNNENWVLKEVEYIGTKNLEGYELDEKIQSKFKKSIFSINPKEVESELNNQFIEIKSIRAEKFFPDKLVVSIEEKVPVLIYINFNGAYVIDSEGEVLKAQHKSEVIEFKESEYDIARGFGSLNSSLVEDRVIENIDEDELEDFSIEEVDPKIKQDILEIIALEKKAKLDRGLEFPEYQIFGVKEIPLAFSWDERVFKEGESVDKDEMNFMSNIISGVKSQVGLPVKRAVWDGDLRLIVEISDGPDLVFSPSIGNERTAQIQIEDVQSVVNQFNRDYSKLGLVDVSSEKLLVEYK